VPRIIVTSRYLKNAPAPKLANLVHYIGKREGTEMNITIDRNAPVTQKQLNLISQLEENIPMLKSTLEHEDYRDNPTVENASELIDSAIERNVDLIGNRQNFVSYMGRRLGVEKLETHGLFSQTDAPIVLSHAAKEVAGHEGNVWTHVISIKREDAQRLDYDNLNAWRNLIRRKANDLALYSKIPLENLKWYASFHNTSHHPHVHLLIFSKDINEGYLTKTGIDGLRSTFANDIFHDDLLHLYCEQTDTRNALRIEAREITKEIALSIQNGVCDNSKIEGLLLQLSEKLQSVKGQKLYGYLPKSVKVIVDEIVSELSKDNRITELYKKWCELTTNKLQTYSDNPKPQSPLINQPEFKSIKNTVIKEALQMGTAVSNMDYESIDEYKALPELEQDELFMELPAPLDIPISTLPDIADAPYFKLSDAYKLARSFLYGSDGKKQDYQIAFKLFEEEAKKGNALAAFDIGQMYNMGYGTEQDYGLTQYSLGGLYYCGNGVEQSYEQAFHYYIQSANQNNSYAQYEIGKMYHSGQGTEVNESESKIYFTKAYCNFEQLEATCADDKLWYRLGQMCLKGIGTEVNLDKAKSYFLKSANIGNVHAQYALGKIGMESKNVSANEMEDAVQWLRKAADSSNELAQHALGKLYLNGDEFIPKNTPLAVDYLTSSAEKENSYAQYQLGKLYLDGTMIMQDIAKSLTLLTKSATQNNPNAQYLIGKAYLDGKLVPQDIDKAIEWLRKSAEQKNAFAAYKLGKLYLSEIYINSNYILAEKWLIVSAEQDNGYALYALGRLFLDERYRDANKAEKWLTKSSKQGNHYAMLSLARLYLDGGEMQKNVPKAIELLTKAAEKGNSFASYTLGKLYLYGQDVSKDEQLSEYWLKLCAGQGNQYVAQLLERKQTVKSPSAFNLSTALLHHLSRIISNDYNQRWHNRNLKTDKKLRSAIAEKKQALGIRDEQKM
jgi:TPR repeat protein